MTHHPTTIYTADIGALTFVLTSSLGYLPAAAAGLAALWYLVQIYDRFFGR